MDIKILGGGCPKCNKLEANTRKALDELGINADIQKVKETTEIMNLGVMRTPTLMVDGKAIVTGRVANPREIKKLLTP